MKKGSEDGRFSKLNCERVSANATRVPVRGQSANLRTMARISKSIVEKRRVSSIRPLTSTRRCGGGGGGKKKKGEGGREEGEEVEEEEEERIKAGSSVRLGIEESDLDVRTAKPYAGLFLVVGAPAFAALAVLILLLTGATVEEDPLGTGL